VVIGETAQVGDDCTIYQGVTLGGTRLYKGEKRHPTLGKGVVVGAGAKVLGGFTVGDGARIGSNAVVVRPVPDGATAVGNPARIIEHKDPVEQTKQTVTEQARQEASRATERALDREFEVCCDEGKLDTEPLQALLSSQGSKVIADKTAPGSTASVQIGATTPAAQDSVAGAPAGSESGQPEFTAYAVDTGDTDPLIKVVQELIDHAAHQDARIAQLCQAIESLGKKVDNPENGALDAERLNRLVE
jgi:serine O-acetyltransferase